MDFSELDDMSEEEMKQELMAEKFDDMRRPELVEEIAELFDLDESDYSYGNLNVSALKKIYVRGSDMDIDIPEKTRDEE